MDCQLYIKSLRLVPRLVIEGLWTANIILRAHHPLIRTKSPKAHPFRLAASKGFYKNPEAFYNKKGLTWALSYL